MARTFLGPSPAEPDRLAAFTVPAQLRKSLAEISAAVMSRREALTSEDDTACTAPSPLRYSNRCWPGNSWQERITRATRRSLKDRLQRLPLLPRNRKRSSGPFTLTCPLRKV